MNNENKENKSEKGETKISRPRTTKNQHTQACPHLFWAHPPLRRWPDSRGCRWLRPAKGDRGAPTAVGW